MEVSFDKTIHFQNQSRSINLYPDLTDLLPYPPGLKHGLPKLNVNVPFIYTSQVDHSNIKVCVQYMRSIIVASQ